MADPSAIDLPLFLAGAGAGVGGLVLGIERGMRLIMNVRSLRNGTTGTDSVAALVPILTKIAADLSNYELHGEGWRERIAAQLAALTTAQATHASALAAVATATSILMDRTART